MLLIMMGFVRENLTGVGVARSSALTPSTFDLTTPNQETTFEDEAKNQSPHSGFLK